MEGVRRLCTTEEQFVARIFAVLAMVIAGISSLAQKVDSGWPTYGGDPGGQRFSSATEINRATISRLHLVWTYHTHALDSRVPGSYAASFEATPVLFHGLLYLTSPFDEIIALDPVTGTERWHYQPPLETLVEADITTSRGVATWSGGSRGACASRIFVGTNDARLWAVDAADGKPCDDFGDHGSINLKAGLTGLAATFHITSAPTVLGDVVVVGSSISDNTAVNMASGAVRAYNVRTGQPVWKWEPIPWGASQNPPTGAGNVWSTIAADPQLGLVYVPTGSASPDYYGGMRPGDDRDANSIVALDATTGRKIWAFQVVHHDLWDYDIASEPLLFAWHGNIPAIAVIPKTGMVFVLDRRNGKPLFPVEERPVPQSDIPGEDTSPTQPFPALPSLSPTAWSADLISPDRDAADRDSCLRQISALRYEGIYTPPSLKGSLVFPGAIGGINWGSTAYDPVSGVLYANTNSLPYFVQLVRRKTFWRDPVVVTVRSKAGIHVLVGLAVACALILLWRWRRRGMIPAATVLVLTIVATLFCFWLRHLARRGLLITPEQQRQLSLHAAFGDDRSPQMLAPYSLYRHPIYDSHGQPCSAEPWGSISALNLQTGTMAWQVAHGTQIAGRQTGAASLGGVMVTAGGLLFSAGTREPMLRAYDSSTGKELWKAELPVPAQATPMSYSVHGRQFVVLAAGGDGLWGTPQGDAVIAFALR